MAQIGHTPSSSAELVIVLPNILRCKYKNRFCNNHRATKDNGELHSLCEEHRSKANQNQQRLRDNQRRRQARMLGQSQAIDTAAVEEAKDPVIDVEMGIEPLHPSADESLSSIDWQELADLWTDEEGVDSSEEQQKHGD